MLSNPHEDGTDALEALVDALGAGQSFVPVNARKPVEFSRSRPLDAQSIMQVVAMHLPEQAILADESLSSGFPAMG
ncbi:hypothetical protein R70199_07375 [Paraburkholderia domus]|nr:hypothetical protein [Paraburkholderia domus]CAE6961800.1 hypothetical protein R70199_07375 [Paraburkholderia domus]